MTSRRPPSTVGRSAAAAASLMTTAIFPRVVASNASYQTVSAPYPGASRRSQRRLAVPPAAPSSTPEGRQYV